MARQQRLHIPVMRDELIKFLRLDKGGTVLDCTVGLGGHADAILKEIGPEGRLLGIDQDSEALQAAKDRLKRFNNIFQNWGKLRKTRMPPREKNKTTNFHRPNHNAMERGPPML